MKCSNCGCENLKEVSLEELFYIQGDDAGCTQCAGAYICLECGHLEFFNFGYVSDYKKKMQEKKEIEKEVDLKYTKIKELENQKFDHDDKQDQKIICQIKQLKHEISELEEKYPTIE